MTPVRVGVWVKVRVSFSVGSNKTIAPAARVRVWLGVSFGVGGQFFLGAIGLEPISGTLRRKEVQLRENEISDSTSFEEFELSEYH